MPAPAAAGLQNSARAGHEERDFRALPHVLRTRKPSLDAHPNGSPNLSLVPLGPPQLMRAAGDYYKKTSGRHCLA